MAKLKRRGNLKDGVFYIDYRHGGERIQKSLGTRDAKIAQYKFNIIQNKLIEGDKPIISKRVIIGKVLDEYIKNSHSNQSPKHAKAKRLNIERYLKFSGDMYLQNITSRKFEKYLASRLAEGKSQTTVWHDYKDMKAFLNWCIKCDLLRNNPLDNVKRPSVDESDAFFIRDQKQIQKLLDVCSLKNKELYYMVLIMLNTGIRASAWRKLVGEDFDWERCVLRVSKGKGTQRRIRHIPFDPKLKSILPRYRGAEKVFKGIDRADNMPYERLFKTALREAGIPVPKNRLWHILRHTFASHYMMNGGDLYRLSKLLGHRSIKQTERYAHLSPDYLRDAVYVGFFGDKSGDS